MTFTKEEIEAADVVRKGLSLEGAPELYKNLFTAGCIHAWVKMQEESRWIPVAERTPNYTREVLVYGKYFHEIPIQAYYSGGYWYGSYEVTESINECEVIKRGLINADKITHWQELPTPPKQ